MVILKNIDSPEAASEKCEEICCVLHDRFAKEQITISCSVGIAFCSKGEKPSDKLVEQASQALCYTKKENKGSYYVYK